MRQERKKDLLYLELFLLVLAAIAWSLLIGYEIFGREILMRLAPTPLTPTATVTPR